MKTLLALLALATLPLMAQPDMLLSSGVSFDYTTHQPSAILAFSPKIATIAGVPTYSTTTMETSARVSGAQVNTQTRQTITAKTGILQIPFRRAHWGLFTLAEGGVLKYDQATLSTFSGGVGLYIDVIGMATKDKHHGWFSPMLREVSIAGLQIKPVYGALLTTTLSKKD